MEYSYLTYIISIALQIAGALLLMLFALPTKRIDIIKRFIARNLVVRDGDEKLGYDIVELRNAFRTAWLSRFSFGYIVAGYLAGIYGELGENKYWMTAFLIVIVAITLMSVAYFVTFMILRFSKSVNKGLTLEELMEGNIEPNITIMTAREFNEKWEDC